MAGWTDAEFDAFVGARMGALVRFAYALTGDLGHAEDLVPTCAPVPVLTLDEVLGVRVVGRAGQFPVVEVTLTRDDDRTMARSQLPQWAPALIVVAGTRSSWASYEPGTLGIVVPTLPLVDDLLALLAPYPPVARPGPGPLDRPLQVWSVVTTGPPPCRFVATTHKLAVNRLGECLYLDGPVVTVDAADVRIHAPATGGTDWRVTVDPSGPARQALAAWTARHAGQRVVFSVAGQLVGAAETVEGSMRSLDIGVADRGYAGAVVSRMRP